MLLGSASTSMCTASALHVAVASLVECLQTLCACIWVPSEGMVHVGRLHGRCRAADPWQRLWRECQECHSHARKQRLPGVDCQCKCHQLSRPASSCGGASARAGMPNPPFDLLPFSLCGSSTYIKCNQLAEAAIDAMDMCRCRILSTRMHISTWYASQSDST